VRLLASGSGLALFFCAGVAAANPDISGYSGKDYNGVKDVCTTSCHAKGVTPVPTLTITAPTTIKAGATGEVSIKITGTRKATVLNAALTTGSVATAGQNTIIPFAEAEPSEVASGKAIAGATATYKFSFVPPNKNGNITLHVTGMSTNLDDSTGGDAIKSETRTITVTDATPEPPDAGSGASSSSSSTGGTSSSSGTTSKPADGGVSADDGVVIDRTRTPASEADGCDVTRGGFDGGAAFLALAVAAVLASARRRK